MGDEVDWDVLILSECWLRTSQNIPVLEGYNSRSTSNHKTQNEGVVIYYRNYNGFRVSVEEPIISDANCLCITLHPSTCLLAIYRSPAVRDINNFITSLDTFLKKLSQYENIVICGDINIDIASNTSDNRSYKYLNVLASYCILPAHTIPTHGFTCLDHVMLKTKLDATCFVAETSITDHESVGIILNLHIKPKCPPEIKKRINYPDLDKTIHSINFQSILDSNDANKATDELISILNTAIQNNSREVKIPSRRKINKPWISLGLLCCMRNRDNLHKKLKKNPNDDNLKITYKRYRNFCNNLLRKQKTIFEREEITKAKNNNKKLWDVIKNICSTSQKQDNSSALITLDDPMQSANEANKYFSTIGQKLAEDINPSPLNCQKQISSSASSFVLHGTDESEVKSIIMGLREDTAAGIDQITCKIIKRYINLLTEPITHICNLSITSGIFPHALKVALIKPIHKGGNKASINNYRPISLLPSVSKILERLLNKRLMNYLESNALLSPAQFGFRAGKSTNSAVNELIDAITTSIGQRQKCLTIFLDLAKAFDTVSFPNLLYKLEKMGIRGPALKLFEDYLRHRRQRVVIDNCISDELSVHYGVPQGSVLGPSLFLVYINDLCQLSLKDGKIVSFADDTALYFTGNSWEEVFSSAQVGLDRVCQWLRHNVLTLNAVKTKYITFAPRRNLLPKTDLAITVHTCNELASACLCSPLQRTDTIKYLGVYLDQLLTFKPHIDILVTRVRKLIYVFRKLRQVADLKTLRIVYSALCHSIINYCIGSWGGAAKSHLLEVERAQRAVLKVGASLPHLHPTTDTYKLWKVLTVRQTFILSITLRKHSELDFDSSFGLDKRRRANVCSINTFKISLPLRFYCFLGGYLYNKINSLLSIYQMRKSLCKSTVIEWLKSLDYNETENIMTPIR